MIEKRSIIMLVVLDDRFFIRNYVFSSIGAIIGKITTGQVEFLPSVIMMIVSLIASPLDVMTGKKINTKILQVVLVFIV